MATFKNTDLHFLCVWVFCRHVGLCAMYVQCPKKPREGVGSHGAGVTHRQLLAAVYRLSTSPPPQLLSTWLVSAGDSQAFIFRLPALIPKPPQPILWGARQGNRLTMFSILKEVQITWEVLHVRWNGQAPLQKILLKTDLSRAACGPYALRSNSPELVRQTSCDIHLLNQGHAGFWCR